MSHERKFPRQIAWWAETGPETCRFCGAAFHVEIARHCGGCDRPVCPMCVIVMRELGTVFCPECAAEAEP